MKLFRLRTDSYKSYSVCIVNYKHSKSICLIRNSAILIKTSDEKSFSLNGWMGQFSYYKLIIHMNFAVIFSLRSRLRSTLRSTLRYLIKSISYRILKKEENGVWKVKATLKHVLGISSYWLLSYLNLVPPPLWGSETHFQSIYFQAILRGGDHS